MSKILFLLTTILVVGCASSQPEFVWNKANASQQDFYQDTGQCRAQAFSATGANPNVSASFGSSAMTGILMQQVIIFESCLQGKGWYKVPKQ